MTARFPGLVVTDWRTRLVHDLPRLFPDARMIRTSRGPALSCSGWPDVPDGWRSVVETACRRLDAVVADEPGAELVALDMKEKYGTLRVTISGLGLGADAEELVTLAIDLAEARSAHVCDTCGRRGRLSVRGGWYATRCGEHAEGYEPVRARHDGLEVTTTFVDGEPLRSARRYDPITDKFVPAPLPDDEE